MGEQSSLVIESWSQSQDFTSGAVGRLKKNKNKMILTNRGLADFHI